MLNLFQHPSKDYSPQTRRDGSRNKFGMTTERTTHHDHQPKIRPHPHKQRRRH